MIYKSSFGRGFNSSILNSYILGLLTYIFISFILIILSFIESSFLSSLRYKTISISKPFFIMVSKPFSMLNDSFLYTRNLKDIKSINDELIRENKTLKKQLNESNFLLLENHRLKKLLEIKDITYVKKLTARILIDAYKDSNSEIYIDLGKNDGLKINDIVFNENGFIGRIAELGSKSAKVLTLLNENSVIPVTSINTKKSFFVKGNGNKLTLKHVDNKFSLKHGELVVSTSAAGYFKEGINIGRIYKTLNDVYVIPFAKKTDSIYVNVLIYNFFNEFND